MVRHLAAVVVALALGTSLAVLAAEAPEAPVGPAEVIIACAADLTAAREVGGKVLVPALDPDTARTTRYIWNDVGVDKRVIDGHLNALSRRSGIKTAVRVNPWLYRIDTYDYGEAFTQAWEKIGTGVDWVFHDEEFTEELEYFDDVVEYGFWVRPDGSKRAGGNQQHPDEKWETTRTEKVRRQRAVRRKGFAAWVADDPRAKAAFELLQSKMGGTDVPVVAWTQFFYETAIQADRQVGYYGFLGVKDLKTYERVIGVVRKGLDPEFEAELREVVGNSTVTTPETVRRIVHENKVGGDYWYSQDSNQLKVKDAQKGNPLFNHADDYEHQAVETFGHLPNGFWATGLFNDQGVRQDTAPDFIASDSSAPYSDRRVHVNMSCIRCHVNGGMQDIDGWVRNVLNHPPNYLNGRNAAERKRLAQFYVERRLEPFLRQSRERAEAACLEATGMKFTAWSNAYAKAWAEVEGPVTVERAAKELGVTVDRYQQAIIAQKASVHPNLAAHRLPKPRPIPRELWRQAYPYAQYAVHGKIKPFKVKVKVEDK